VIDALFLIEDYFRSKFCPRLSETPGIRVPARYIENIRFVVFYSSPSVRCASTTNIVRKDVDVFGTKAVYRNQFFNDTF
jgi:hypothetical protein